MQISRPFKAHNIRGVCPWCELQFLMSLQLRRILLSHNTECALKCRAAAQTEKPFDGTEISNMRS